MNGWKSCQVGMRAGPLSLLSSSAAGGTRERGLRGAAAILAVG
jgi:hypothetical protein